MYKLDPLWIVPEVYIAIGQTDRTLEHQLNGHKRALTSGKVSQSAFADHAMNEEEAEVVNHHPLYRHVLEALHIQTERHKMNRDEFI